MYAYGETGAPTSKPIPPLANLDFNLMLLKIATPDQHVDHVQEDKFHVVTIGTFEQYSDDASIVFTGNNGTAINVTESTIGKSMQLTRGRKWRSLMGIAMN